MSHNHDTTIICPNCGYDAKYNYCARCGQENHLHKDTFVGLIMHFVGHYFHYDSKFWKTLKLLWFKPGALTIAYREKKRMRYIPPISLYIFISAVFFLGVFLKAPNKEQYKKDFALNTADSLQDLKDKKQLKIEVGNLGRSYEPDTTVHKYKTKYASLSEDKKQEIFSEALENLIHNIPKWFFFMIPLMGFILLLMFVRRKQLYFVDHTIFSLHFHAFVFSAFLPVVLNPFSEIEDLLLNIMILLGIIYFVISLRKVYQISWARSICYSFIVALTYLLFLVIVFILNFAYLFYKQGLFTEA